jgi:hypothetical protein
LLILLPGDGLPLTVRFWPFFFFHPLRFYYQSSSLALKSRKLIFCSAYAGVSLDEFPLVDKWLHTLLQRPGFEKGRNVPDKHTAFETAKLTSEEMDKLAESSRAWIQKGMQDDAKK